MKSGKITVDHFFKENANGLGLRLVSGSQGLERVIREPTINRPGLALTGFIKYFASNRIQVIGSAEVTYPKTLDNEEREKRYETIFMHRIPCVVYSRNLTPD